MNTNQSIEFLKRIKNLELYSDMGYVFEADEIIALLKRGEKYETMWEELEDSLEPEGNPDYSDDIGDYNAVCFMNDIKQKYFPKGGK